MVSRTPTGAPVQLSTWPPAGARVWHLDAVLPAGPLCAGETDEAADVITRAPALVTCPRCIEAMSRWDEYQWAARISDGRVDVQASRRPGVQTSEASAA
ncbi:hypothetical protein ACRB68_80100 [Actinomadura sp. RB68]|uniref:Uncharacterized protein n=1 Tax=Actinomadura macrotermitis TaxID=2585200 RepID=A0A7K0C8V7_9ACTN|nr:hypothetical protein [Actinomadura macrotermitis]